MKLRTSKCSAENNVSGSGHVTLPACK